MQLNVYIPKAKVRLVEQIDRLARQKHRSKNELIVAALEAYLKAHAQTEAAFGTYDLGTKDNALDRGSLYEKRLDPAKG